ncbi:MAG: hypothetical protein ACR2LN_04210 [Candidatus Levyibacteriota bacterium]
MIVIKVLIWDVWNKEHIAKHGITIQEVEEICYGEREITESYRKRILLEDETKEGKRIAIILSPEDRDLQTYGQGIYYPITAYIKEVNK